MAGGAVFVPGDPPRTGRLALWGDALPADAPAGAGDEPGGHERVEIVLPAGNGVRRRHVPARLLTVAEALAYLVDPPRPCPPSVAAWSTAANLGLQLIARGRLVPAASPAGHDAWRVAPLDPADAIRLAELAAAFPPEAHALPIAGTRPLRIRSPDVLIRAVWDALADTLVRTPAAACVAGHAAFADAATVTDVTALHDWLDNAVRSLEPGARPGLRVELPEGPDGEFAAVVQVRSATDPSLVVDAADLWDAPDAVLSRFGDDADTDLFLALRRGAHAWPPLKRLLDEARPEALVLDDVEAGELLGPATEALASAGMEVLWPAELATGGLSLQATARSTPTPGATTDGSFTLDTLLEFDWQVALGGEQLTETEVRELAEAKRPLVRIRGRWVTVDPALLERLRRRRARRMSGPEALAAALRGSIEVDGETVIFSASDALADLASRLSTLASADRAAPPPAGLEATLRPYQQRGLAWLTEMAALGVGGCLADDMGLGKTVQVIALHLARAGHGPTLVVCPTSLLGNWEREIGRFAPAVPVRRFHGEGRTLGDVAGDEIVLATYGVLRTDQAALADQPWGLVVADEAQHVKNPLSRTAKALRTVPAAARIALTGTPVENRLTDLWAILDWTTPGLLGPLETFRRHVAVPIERYGDPDAAEALARVVRPFLLRRHKSDPGIAPELPRKTETDLVVPLTPEQVTLYEAVVRETLADIAQSEGIARRGLVLKLLTALKQICNHPAQYLHQGEPLEGRSGKLAALDELLEVILAEGESVLVFTQYVQMATLIEAHLRAGGITPMLLQGSVPAAKRDEMVRRFQAGEVPVFILSLKAGGTGLNLTRATHVVHYDRWWNPAVEDQATDRAYRIGQDRPVQVHRLVTEGTLEDRIAALLVAKRELADRVVGGGEAWLSELSNDELSSLVSLGMGK